MLWTESLRSVLPEAYPEELFNKVYVDWKPYKCTSWNIAMI